MLKVRPSKTIFFWTYTLTPQKKCQSQIPTSVFQTRTLFSKHTYLINYMYNYVFFSTCGHDFNGFSCSHFFRDCVNRWEISFNRYIQQVKIQNAFFPSQNLKNLQKMKETPIKLSLNNFWSAYTCLYYNVPMQRTVEFEKYTVKHQSVFSWVIFIVYKFE